MADIYRGVPNPKGDMKHWKYIKRVRKNGKWVYYYDQESLKKDLNEDLGKVADAVKDVAGVDEKEARDKADSDYIKAKGDAATALKSYHGYQDYLNNKYKRPEYMNPDGSLKPDIQKQYDKEAEKLKTLHKDYQTKEKKAMLAGRMFGEANRAYMKTPLGAVEQIGRTIDRGREAIADFFENLSKKLRG